MTPTGGPFGVTSTTNDTLSLWDATARAFVTVTAVELAAYKVKAAFMDFLIDADPHIKELWIAFHTKQRILE
jgi:hypothetical protein